MLRRYAPLLAASVLLLFAPRAEAQRAIFLSYSQLQMPNASVATEIEADLTNRVWFGTNAGVTALVGDQQAPGFPLNINDFLLGDAFVGDLTNGLLSDGENFFLAFPRTTPSHLEFGRVLDDRSVSITDSVAIPENIPLPGRPLASDSSDNLWVGSNDGLLQWLLGGSPPDTTNRQNRVFRQGDQISQVEVAPWVQPDGTGGLVPDPAVVFHAENTGNLHIARAADVNARTLVNPNLSVVVGMAFSADDLQDPDDGNLWVAGARGSTELIVRYSGEVLKGPDPGSATPQSFPFGVSLRVLRDITVDPFTGTVWVATDNGAYFQTPLPTLLDPLGTLTSGISPTGDGLNGWTRAEEVSAQGDRFDAAYADPSGNIWFGTSRGIRGILVRLLTLNSSRYLGSGSTVVASLEDIPSFAGNGQVDTATIRVDGLTGFEGATTITAEEEAGDTGTFTFTYQLVTGEPQNENQWGVADGATFSVAYPFIDARGNDAELLALASFANIVPFDDDFWIGNFPCFIGSLSH